jgi:hypothetical protein
MTMNAALRGLVAMVMLLVPSRAVAGQSATGDLPRLRAAVLSGTISIDGQLTEPDWARAEVLGDFKQTEPRDGDAASVRTEVRVLAGPREIVVGISCDDPNADRIVSFSVRHDASLNNEDHVRLLLGPFGDGRSGYIFAVNPSGARYDALIEPGGGDGDNPDWDGIWDARTSRSDTGWTAEIWLPLPTLAFKPGLREWQFNVQRRIQRLLETDRWASAARQYRITQVSRAGLLTDLPDFVLGKGLSVRPSLTGGGERQGGERASGEFQPSLDVTQRIGANLLASGTANTDFAETEVDTRRTNLTRFPLFFPEKRTFFLEGTDIFSFGLGLGQDVVPFFSRRIGLVSGSEVPITAGGKVNGRIGNTNVGGLAVGTRSKPGVVNDPTFLAAGRVKQNLWRESWVGAVASVGDPLGRSGSWMGGVDFTYATSRFRGDKNLFAGVWALATGREQLPHDASAYGLNISYPNDRWNISLNTKRIGRDFDPSLGFVPRRAVYLINVTMDNRLLPASGPLQQLEHEFRPFLATNLEGRWESYRVFFAPLNWRFRSGDRVELNTNPTGERLVAPFQVSSGVFIPRGSYHWRRYRLELDTARKRRFYTTLTVWTGGFYDGTLQQFIWNGAWNPAPLFTVEFTGERNYGDVSGGDFVQTLVGNRLRLNMSPDLTLASYVQYDTDSHSIGVNTRFQWRFRPVGDLFVVYNHNVRSIEDRWQLESNQLLLKLQYTWRS